MSGRNHRTPGVVRAVCTDPCHEGKEHYLTTLKLVYQIGVTALRGRGIKEFRRADGDNVFRFACGCGRDVQIKGAALTPIVLELFAADPGATRVSLDITRL